jgi:hypothetical protein
VSSHSVTAQDQIIKNSKESHKADNANRETGAKPEPTLPSNGNGNQRNADEQAKNSNAPPRDETYSVKVVSQPREPLYVVYVIINGVIAAVGVATVIAVFVQGRTMKRQLRAFIQTQKPQLACSPNGNPARDIFDVRAAHFQVAVQNVGLTVAYDCSWQSWIEIVTPPFEDFSDKADQFISPNPFSLLPKHDPMVLNLVITSGISSIQKARILSHDLWICFRVKIDYSDAFTPKRYANFCFRIEGSGLQPLPKYNDSN